MLHVRSDGKPRDLLRKAYSLITEGADRNWEFIDGHGAAAILDSFTDPDEDYYGSPSGASVPTHAVDWSEE